jgi:hypothetical protein
MTTQPIIPRLCGEISASCERNPEPIRVARLVGMMPRQKAAAMAAYRFCFLDGSNHIQKLEDHNFEHDAQAIYSGAAACESHGSEIVEIWQGTRLVVRHKVGLLLPS